MEIVRRARSHPFPMSPQPLRPDCLHRLYDRHFLGLREVDVRARRGGASVAAARAVAQREVRAAAVALPLQHSPVPPEEADKRRQRHEAPIPAVYGGHHQRRRRCHGHALRWHRAGAQQQCGGPKRHRTHSHPPRLRVGSSGDKSRAWSQTGRPSPAGAPRPISAAGPARRRRARSWPAQTPASRPHTGAARAPAGTAPVSLRPSPRATSPRPRPRRGQSRRRRLFQRPTPPP